MLRCQFNCECPVNMHVASRVSEQLLSPANAMSLYYKHGLPAHFNILTFCQQLFACTWSKVKDKKDAKMPKSLFGHNSIANGPIYWS